MTVERANEREYLNDEGRRSAAPAKPVGRSPRHAPRRPTPRSSGPPPRSLPQPGRISTLATPLSTTPAIATRHIYHAFTLPTGQMQVLADVSLDVDAGEFVSIIGPSACGKSTLLTILTGLKVPDAGDVMINGHIVTGRLGMTGYMPQKDLLMPWKTVLDNTALGLELAGAGRARARQTASSWFARFGLAGFERTYPSALSGGMRQRAALLRTFLAGRDILLLDEPFGALDALTRASMQAWLLDVWTEFGKTILLVTHDIDEAIFLSDRIYVMTPRPGRITRTCAVPFPRPRVYEDTVTAPEFGTLKRELLALLTGSTAGPA